MFAHKLTDDTELKLLEPRHAEELYALINQNRDRLRPWMSFPENATSVDAVRASIKNWLHQFADEQSICCGIFHKGHLIGGIGVMSLNLRNRSAEFCYWLDENAEHKGLITTSCRVLLDYCFNKISLNRVMIRAAPENQRSKAVIARLGAKYEGTQRQSIMINGRFLDQDIFSILKSERKPSSLININALFTHKLDDKTEIGLLESLHSLEMFTLIDRNREHLRRWLPWVDETRSESDTLASRKRFLHSFADNGTIVTGIWHCGSLAGAIGLHTVAAKCKEIGYWLGEEFQGKGLMTMACKALINHSFIQLGDCRIEIRAEPDNTRSRAIPERLGFICEGILRNKGMNADGKLVDLVSYSMLKDEWAVKNNVH